MKLFLFVLHCYQYCLFIFLALSSTVRLSLQDACVQILSPKRRIDILRDALYAKQRGQPYTITFCGVNGVGKSTNLSKVSVKRYLNGYTTISKPWDSNNINMLCWLITNLQSTEV